MLATRTTRWGVLSMLFVSCTGNAPALGAQGDTGPSRAAITVVNKQWSDVRVYIRVGDITQSLGRIGALDRKTFTIPPALRHETVTFVVGPLRAGGRFTTREVTMAPGRRLELWVANPLRASYLVKS